jgi:hypothetical protein
MAVTTIGLTTLKFGTSTVTGTAVVSSYEETIRSEPVELAKGDGTFQAVAYANPHSTGSITIIQGATSYGGVGAAIGNGGNELLSGKPSAMFVENVQINARNDGFTETTISLIGWDNLGQAS